MTPKRRALWRLLALGLPIADIARAFGISEHTVHNNVDHLYQDLGVSNRHHVTFIALAHGVVTLEDALALLPHMAPIAIDDDPSPWLPPRRPELPEGTLAPSALRLTADQLIAVCERDDIPAGVLAKGMDVHRNTITAIRSGQAFHAPGPRDIGPRKQGLPLLTGKALIRAIALRRSGMSYAAIARDNGTLGWAAVRVELIRAIGVTPSAPRGKPRPGSRRSRVWPFVQEGLSYAEIAKRTGLTASQAWNAVEGCKKWAQNRKPYWADREDVG